MKFHFSALKPNLHRVQENYLSQLDIHGLVTLDLLGLGAQTLLQAVEHNQKRVVVVSLKIHVICNLKHWALQILAGHIK